MNKLKAYWAANKDRLIRKAVVYGGIGLGIAAVGYLAAKDEQEKEARKADQPIDFIVVYENN